MRGPGRFEVDVMNPSLGQLLAEVFRGGTFYGTDPQEKHFHFLVKRGRVGKHAAVGGLGIESAAKRGTVAAESAQIGKLVEIGRTVKNDCIPPIESPAMARFSRPGTPDSPCSTIGIRS